MKKEEGKGKDSTEIAQESEDIVQITTKAELKTFITGVRDRLFKEQAPPIFAMVAMKQVMTLDNLYELIDAGVKETLQEIWVRLSQAGFHLRKPPLLFGDLDPAQVK